MNTGRSRGIAGQAAYDSIFEAAELAKAGRIDAMATTPINKESLRAADINTIGHTELLGEFTKTSNLMTLFQTNRLRVFFLTRHLSLLEACRSITYEKVLTGIMDTYRSMLLLGMRESQIPGHRCRQRAFRGRRGLILITENTDSSETRRKSSYGLR